MQLFNNILGVIVKRLSFEEERLNIVASAMNEITGLSIIPQNLTLRKGVIFVSLPPTAKMALLLKKDTIIHLCQERGVCFSAIA